MTRAEAENAVRLGDRTAYIVIKPGFGNASERMFYGSPKEIELGVDPRRQAESGMVEGLLMKHAAADMQKMFTDPAASARMADKALADIKQAPDAAAPRLAPGHSGSSASSRPSWARGPRPVRAPPAGGSNEWQPLKVTARAVAREYRGPQNAFDITFPQGVIWGLIGCVMTFGISLVTERTHGTLVRLRMAPLTRAQILGGKALACFISIMLVEVMLLGVALALRRPPLVVRDARAGGRVRRDLLRRLHDADRQPRQDRAVGVGRGVGDHDAAVDDRRRHGAAVRDAGLDAGAGVISPIRWALLAIEGGVWRQFTLGEMVLPCTILIAVGIACFAVGTRGLKEA